MSYLELPGGIADFSKAVISLWFRVPQASMQSAFNDFNPDSDTDGGGWGWFTPPFNGIVPLIAFGSPEVTTGDSIAAGLPITPCYIGVDTRTPQNVSSFQGGFLAVGLQMSTQASGQTGHLIKRPDAFLMEGYFQVSGGVINLESSSVIKVAPDHWHHVLVSFDIKRCGADWDAGDSPGTGTGFTIVNSSDFWLAFDDTNYSGLHLAPSAALAWANTGTPSNNAVITQGTVNVNLPVNAVTNWAPVPVMSGGNPVGIPDAAVYVNNVYPVELAELQFFTDVTLDTSIEANRRAFISASSTPDPDHPEVPQTGGTPVDPTEAATLLGINPDVLLHGSANWVAGKNTGPMIVNPDYNPLLPTSADNPLLIPDPAKQFTPTGKIVSYTPDPSLHGPQSPGPPPAVRLERRIRVPA